MANRNMWKQLINLMGQERVFLDDFTKASDEMRAALHEKNWPSLEVSLKKMDQMADLMEAVEKKRHLLTEKISSGNKQLDRLVSELPLELRREFQTERTELKARLLLVRSRLQGVSGYAESRGRLGRELMEELVPSTRGRMYNSQGRSASAGRDPLVISHHL